MNKSNRTDDQLRQICTALLSQKINPRALELSLGEFRRLYSIMVELLDQHVPISSIVGVGREVFVQFSNVSPQHFLVTDVKALCEEDFDFVISKIWHGPHGRAQSFWNFVGDEVRLNRRALLAICVVSACLVWGAHDNGLYDLLSALLIQSATVFFSIYLIFTVTQNQTLQSDSRLFEQGILQKYYADDRNITILGIVTIALTFVNAILSHLLPKLQLRLPIGPIILDERFWLALTTALTISLLFDTFLTVANYYLERNRDIAERNLVADILYKDFERNHPDARQKRDSSRK